MKNYTLNEINGMSQGQIILVNAEDAIEAMKKADMVCWVREYEKFNTFYSGKIYEIYETGKPNNVEYICHR